jgi:hypothetical protein
LRLFLCRRLGRVVGDQPKLLHLVERLVEVGIDPLGLNQLLKAASKPLCVLIAAAVVSIPAAISAACAASNIA